MSSSRRTVRALLVAGALGTTAQCTKLPYEPLQIVVVEMETQGSDIDADGYVATIDDVMSQPVAINGSARFEGIGPGERMLTIGGLAPNCAVVGPNPRPLFIEEDAVTLASVTVTCSPTAGLLNVEASTTGTEVDPDGYAVSVDDSDPRTIGANGSLTFEGLTSGDHVVALENIADNCRLIDEQPNPRVVTLTSDAPTTARFLVHCGPQGGALVVVVSTTGTDLDPDGYAISVEDVSTSPIPTNGAVTFTDLEDGDYVVTIDGVANNCSLTDGPRSRTVTVTSSASASMTFYVHCSPPAGSLVVDVTTTGTDVDADGYMVSVGETITKTVSTNGSATFEGLAAGEYLVELSGVAGNCQVVIDETPNPRTITLTPGASTATTFFVHCQPVAGALVVDVSTFGAGPEPDGYSISVDGLRTKTVSANGAALFEQLLAGEHVVGLGDMTEGCYAEGANPRTVDVAPGSSTRASLRVFCGGAAHRGVRVEVSTGGSDPDPDGYTISLDGGPPIPVATDGSVTLTDLDPGGHTVRIDGLTENCALSDGPEFRDVTVTSEALAVVRFDVECESISRPGTGSMWVKARTSGENRDPDGYRITVDETLSRTVPINGGILFADISAGEHTVRIEGIAVNCSLDGRPTRVVTVPAGETVQFRFFIDCEG